MKRLLLCLSLLTLGAVPRGTAQESFTLEQVLSAPFPANLVASKTGERLAWTLNERGHNNIWVAEGPSFAARRLTAYDEDDGGELAQVQFTADGASLVYVRGEGKNGAGQYANPTSNPARGGAGSVDDSVERRGTHKNRCREFTMPFRAGESCIRERWADMDCKYGGGR